MFPALPDGLFPRNSTLVHESALVHGTAQFHTGSWKGCSAMPLKFRKVLISHERFESAGRLSFSPPMSVGGWRLSNAGTGVGGKKRLLRAFCCLLEMSKDARQELLDLR